MDHACTMIENLALTILAREGIAAIRQLHLGAVEVHRAGDPSAAASILIADAAEEAWTPYYQDITGRTSPRKIRPPTDSRQER